MTYQEFIDYNRTKDQGPYIHRHHIIPKSAGGTDDPDNLIELSWLTHYYAHMLLAKENPDDKLLVMDFKKMGSVSSYLYKCYHAKGKKGVKWSEEAKRAFSERCKGKIFSEEHKKNLSKAHIGNEPWNKGKSGYHCKSFTGHSNKGQHWYTDGVINIMCKSCPDGFHLGRTYERKKHATDKSETI